jgi:hypothetical protein
MRKRLRKKIERGTCKCPPGLGWIVVRRWSCGRCKGRLPVVLPILSLDPIDLPTGTIWPRVHGFLRGGGWK